MGEMISAEHISNDGLLMHPPQGQLEEEEGEWEEGSNDDE